METRDIMRRYALLLLLLASLWASRAQAQSERVVLVLTATGPLTPAMIEYLDRGLLLAERRGAEALVLQLDTPGGQIDHMNQMVQSIRASAVPVVVYVAPRGAIAASAGTVITLAGHAAAMAPETAIGAASPVGGQGEDLGETIERKEKEILKATVRGLAARRGETAVALAEATIEEAKAASAQEALEAGLIDLIAEDVEDLVARLDGLPVELQAGARTLHTGQASIEYVSQSFIEQLLGALTNPNIVFLLMAVGVQAVLIEIGSPGGWAAGLVGVACLSLGALGLGVLPVNWFGIIFIASAFVVHPGYQGTHPWGPDRSRHRLFHRRLAGALQFPRHPGLLPGVRAAGGGNRGVHRGALPGGGHPGHPRPTAAGDGGAGGADWPHRGGPHRTQPCRDGAGGG
jgi:membrane-bound serine protease (ClpP class)